MAENFRFDTPTRFVVGAVGEKSVREFFVQVREDDRLLTMSLDEDQLIALATHVARVLNDVQHMSMGMLNIPEAYAEPRDSDPLDLPMEGGFPIGTIAIGWDAVAKAVHIDFYSEGQELLSPDQLASEDAVEAGAADDIAHQVAIVTIAPDLGRDFVARAHRVLGVLAPACPLCAQPVEEQGHICPRLNGYRGPRDWMES